MTKLLSLDDVRTYCEGTDILAHRIYHEVRKVDPGLAKAFEAQSIAVDFLTDEVLEAIEDGEIDKLEKVALGAGFYATLDVVRATSEAAAEIDDPRLATAMRGQTHVARVVTDLAVELLQFLEPDPTQPDPEFPKLEEAEGQNPFVYFAEKRRRDLQGSPLPDVIDVLLPAGAYKGVNIYPERKYLEGLSAEDTIVPWWGDSRLRFLAPSADSTTILASGGLGWGTSLNVSPVPGWAGRVFFHGMTIRASGANAVALGEYCPSGMHQALHQITFEVSRILDDVNPARRCRRPISANLTGLEMVESVFDLGNAWEHAGYTRNPLYSRVRRCAILRVGGQFWQSVNRATEYGAPCFTDTPRRLSVIADCDFRRPHLDASRAGYGITIAGDNQDWLVEGCTLSDDGQGKNHKVPNGAESYGGLVAWDGGGKGNPFPGTKRYNGHVTVRNTTLAWNNPERSTLSFKNADSVTCENVRVFYKGTKRSIEVRTEALPFEWRRTASDAPQPTAPAGYQEVDEIRVTLPGGEQRTLKTTDNFRVTRSGQIETIGGGAK